MAGIEEELWNIFTFYTLRGNPLDLTRLSVTQFLRLAKDCQIVDDGRANIDLQSRSPASAVFGSKPQLHGGRRLGQAAVNLAFASVIQGRSKVASAEGYRYRKHRNTARSSPSTAKHTTAKSKLTYPEFLDALVVLGERMYRESRSKPVTVRGGDWDRSVKSTFQQLLMEHILPLASRRRPSSISDAITDPLVRDLLQHYRPAFREFFRFYAVSSSAAVHNSNNSTSTSSGGSNSDNVSGEGISKETARTSTVDHTNEQPQQQQPVDAGPEPAPPLSQAQSPNGVGHVPTNPGALAEVDAIDAAAAPAAAAAPSFCSAPASVKYFEADAPASDINSAPAPYPQQAPPRRASRCPSSISWPFPQEGVSGGPETRPEGDVRDGARLVGGGDRIAGVDRGGRGRRAPSLRSSQSSSTAPRVATMNSMADAISHQCLLYFAADFGVSGALLSALEVGEVFLSCDGRLAETLSGDSREQNGPSGSRCTHRTGLARAGEGRIRPLTFHEFLEVLVRISLACFRPGGGGTGLDTPQGNGNDLVGPGQCLRALLAHIWRRLHDSAELALNGVRAGGLRHRSSIQKGALLKGVKLFNEEMISRWRNEGFLDFASSNTARGTPASLGSVLRCAPRQGHAIEMLRDMLAVEQGAAETDLQRHRGEAHNDGGEGIEAAALNPGARDTRIVVGIPGSH